MTAVREQICSFVLALFLYASHSSYVSLRAFRDDADGAWGYEDWSTVRIDGSLDPVVDAAFVFACRCAEATERVCFAPPIATFTNPNKADAASLADGLVITSELDSNPTAAREKLKGILGPPTVAMESGGEWIDAESGEGQPKVHLHWRLATPARSPIEHDFLRECNRLAATLAGGDPSAIPAVHPLRWPGSVHRKSTPRLAHITELNPEVEITLADALAKLREAVKTAGNGADPNPQPHRSSEPQADALDIAAALAVIPNDIPGWTAEESWNFFNKVGMATWRASAGSEAGYAAFAAWAAKSKRSDASNTRKRWDHYSSSPPSQVGAGTLFHLAKEARPDFVKPSDRAKPKGPGEPPPGFDDPPPIGVPVDNDATSPSPATPAPPAAKAWPEIADEAYHGLAGDVVELLAPQTEADPVALLLHFLVMAGNAAGRTTFYRVGATRHYAVENVLFAGKTAKARKGTALNEVERLFVTAAPDWIQNCRHSGLSSGEGLIFLIHDEVVERVRIVHQGHLSYATGIKHPNIEDKRAFISETEFGGTLAVMRRDGSILSRVIRDFWDCRPKVSTLTKNSPVHASEPMVSIIGHITVEEAQALIDRIQMANGVVNRFLIAAVQRSQLLPFGGNVDPMALDDLAFRVDEALAAVLPGEISFTVDGADRWEAIYTELSRDQPGLLGAAVARAEPHTIRIAMIYALLDKATAIDAPHLEAALAVWKFCKESARLVFGDATGDPIADEILTALRQAGPAGLTRNQIRDLFSGHQGSNRVGAALGVLLKHGKARCRQQRAFRQPEMWVAV